MSQQKRKYTFKNEDYWNKLRSPKTTSNVQVKVVSPEEAKSWSPASFDISRASSAYSSPRGTGSTTTRRNQVARKVVEDEYINLENMSLPYSERNGCISIRDSIQLCQRVYANIAIFRNTIDVMTEFSCADIYLTGGNETSRTVVDNWMRKAQISQIQEYAEREYYQSGNVFIVSFYGLVPDEEIKKLKISTASKKMKIPLRYTVLNPADVVVFPAASFDKSMYRKVLNDYECQKLRDRKTDEDKAIYAALPDDVKKQIDSGSWGKDGVWMPINSDRLTCLFYKKQPYAPFAVPFGYPVLRDLNHKEELKKIDQAISRTIDNVILLVTMGEKKDDAGNGMNPEAMQKMQELLQNESIGRVLVSDYTTQMKFIIPEIGNVLDPKKYERVDRDIKEGLLNILSGEDKFANAVMKTQIFLERLKEGRKSFIDNFLQPEINALCKTFGFKSIPTAHHQELDLKDQVQYAKIYTRLVEVGILTPEQGIKALQTGILPELEDMVPAQEVYDSQRKRGLWNPLLGGVPQALSPEADLDRQSNEKLGTAKMAQDAKKAGVSQPNATNTGRPTGSTGTPKETVTPSPQGTSTASIAEIAKEKHLVSLKKFKSTVHAVSDLMNRAEADVKKKYSLAELNDTQKDLVTRLTSYVISSSDMSKWNERLTDVTAEPEKYLTSFASNEITEAVEKLAAEHQVDTYAASLLYHSKWEQ